MAKIGLVPGRDWDAGTLDPAVANALAGAPQAALEKVSAHLPRAGQIANGWQIRQPTGVYGTDYLQRAALNFEGPGWNLAEDAVYPSTTVDSDGKPLSGASRYLIHLASGHLPPARAFWSMTIYDHEGFFVANPLGRVSVSQRDTFTVNQDGSIDLYVQHQSPGTDNEANWLPCPQEGFRLFMRLYWPDQKKPVHPGRLLEPARGRASHVGPRQGRPACARSWWLRTGPCCTEDDGVAKRGVR
jgi:hypothetical protein